ncbi:H-X9-DG-CTERM domain-containing protein [Puniceicoccus vermicola]|nr:H-X9-DG-CTERM domain-containing protein [Puniceicoccus vermicola]
MHNPRARSDFSSDGAFTLVESLLVIAIIAILAAIIIPVTQTVRTRMAATVSQSNLRQLGVLFQQYQANHDFELPPASHSYDGRRMVWDHYLAEYLEDDSEIEALLHSPADTLKRRWNNQEPRTYSMVRANGLGVAATSRKKEAPPVARGLNIPEPMKVLLLVERSSDTNVVFGDSVAVTDNPNQQLTHGADMYGGKFNYLYMDGHVEFLNPEETIGDGTMAAPGGGWTIRDTD